MAKSRTYDYSPPSYDQTIDRAERKGSMYDSLLKDTKIYRAKQGPNLLRILPPGWPKAQHYGLTIYVHRDVGPNDRQYLCLRENPSSPYKRCPICEELYNLGQRATQQDRQLLRAKANIIYYVIDRDNEKDGVQVWMSSPTTDSEIAAQSVNRRSKSVIDIVHPEDGYDLEFTRSGQGKNNTRYRGFQIMREPSPLHDNPKRADEWLDVVFDKPLPSILNFYPPERIEEVFLGTAKDDGEDGKSDRRSRSDDDEDEREDRPLRRTRDTEEDEERPSRSRRAASEEDDEVRPSRRSRAARADDEEGEVSPRRRRANGADDDEDARPSRSARAGRDDDDAQNDAPRRERASPRSDDDEERPARARRSAPVDDADDEPARPPRSRLSRELDDEVPTEGGRRARPNGRDRADEDEEERPARRRRASADDDEDEAPRRSPRRRGADDDEDEPAAAAADADESRRERMRSRLNRE